MARCARSRAAVHSCEPRRESDGRPFVGSDVAGEPVGLVDRDEHHAAVAEFHLQVFALESVHFPPHQAGEQADAEFDVDHKIPGFEIGIDRLRRERLDRRTPARLGPDPAENFVVSEQVQVAEGESLLQRTRARRADRIPAGSAVGASTGAVTGPVPGRCSFHTSSSRSAWRETTITRWFSWRR